MALIFILFALLATKTTFLTGSSIYIDSDLLEIILENETIPKDSISIKNQENVSQNNEIDDRMLFPKDDKSDENPKIEFSEEGQGIEIPQEEHKGFSIEDHLNHIPGYKNSYNETFYSLRNGKLPDRFDWREQQKVTPVRDQNECMACWAFSMTATIESHMMIYREANKYLDLSEQMLIDCLENSPGCKPGNILQSYSKLVSQIGAMMPEEEYPYVDRQEQCHGLKYYQGLSIAGFKRIFNDEELMKRYLVLFGPLTAAINSNSMKTYTRVVIDEPAEYQCPPNHLDHAVEIVGYDYYRDAETVDKSKQYWIIKNSWGTNWGENGYYYLVLGKNACGIAQDVIVPLLI